MRAITKYLRGLGYTTVEDGYYDFIGEMGEWYSGKVRSFHTYRQYNGRRRIIRERASLGMAKTVSEDWANLVLSQKVEIIIEHEKGDEIRKVLDDNNFTVRGNRLAELAFALGTGAFVEYLDGGKIVIDYVRASMIYPLSWENGEVIECAFASERAHGGKRYIYLNIHTLEDGEYVVHNRMFTREGEKLTPCELPEDIEGTVYTGSHLALFQFIRPNVVNNYDTDCPLGISVYANAIDVLRGIDLVYDSYCNEFRLGKKRIVVPTTMARTILEEDGGFMPIFDDNDVEFYALDLGNDSEPSLREINMQLRSEPHEQGLDRGLNLLSLKCGLGNNRYRTDRSGAVTATEVISERSELYQNLKKHELVIQTAIERLVEAVSFLLGLPERVSARVVFDDTLIEDVTAEKERCMREVEQGLRPKWEYRVKWMGESEERAKEMTRDEM